MNRHQFHFVRTRVFRALSATLIFLAVWSPALGFDGKPTPIMDLVPSDALVVYAAKPYSFLMGESPTQSDGETKPSK